MRFSALIRCRRGVARLLGRVLRAGGESVVEAGTVVVTVTRIQIRPDAYLRPEKWARGFVFLLFRVLYTVYYNGQTCRN